MSEKTTPQALELKKQELVWRLQSLSPRQNDRDESVRNQIRWARGIDNMHPLTEPLLHEGILNYTQESRSHFEEVIGDLCHKWGLDLVSEKHLVLGCVARKSDNGRVIVAVHRIQEEGGPCYVAYELFQDDNTGEVHKLSHALIDTNPQDPSNIDPNIRTECSWDEEKFNSLNNPRAAAVIWNAINDYVLYPRYEKSIINEKSISEIVIAKIDDNDKTLGHEQLIKQIVDLEPLKPATIKDGIKLLAQYIPVFIKSIPDLKSAVLDLKRNKKRDLATDMLAINEKYGTHYELEGVENIPQSGGFVLAISHVAYSNRFPGWQNLKANPIWWAAAVVSALDQRRGDGGNFRALAYAPVGSKFDYYWRRALEMYGILPVNSANPKEALQAIGGVIELIKSGQVVLISPEGESNTGLSTAKRGVAKLAKADCVFVPTAFVEKKEKDGKFRYIARFGLPIKPDQNQTMTKEAELQFIQNLMTSIAGLLPWNRRGVYR